MVFQQSARRAGFVRYGLAVIFSASAQYPVRSAMARHESRGLHYSRDYPETLSSAQDTVLTPKT